MRNAILILALVLVGQVVLMFLTAREPAVMQSGAAGPLVAFETAAVEEIRLTDGASDEELVLRRDGDVWLLPEYFAFGADTGKVESLLERLSAFQRGWPEATTTEAAQRFKVAEGAFERRLTLVTGAGDPITVWFGTSPGFRRIYSRPEGSEAIYAVTLGLHDLPVAAKEWVDTKILHMDAAGLTGLEMPGIKLVKGEQGLEPEGVLTTEEVNREEVDRLVQGAAELEISEVLAADIPEAEVLDTPELTIRFRTEGDAEVVYELSRPFKAAAEGAEQQDNGEEGREAWYLLRAPGHDHLFRVDGWQVTDLVDVDRADLVRPAEQGQQPREEGPVSPAQQ